MAVTWRDQIGDWGYSVSANLTTIKNEVKSLVQEGYSIIAGDKQQSYTMAGISGSNCKICSTLINNACRRLVASRFS